MGKVAHHCAPSQHLVEIRLVGPAQSALPIETPAAGQFPDGEEYIFFEIKRCAHTLLRSITVNAVIRCPDASASNI